MSVTTDVWITAAYQHKLIDFTHMSLAGCTAAASPC